MPHPWLNLNLTVDAGRAPGLPDMADRRIMATEQKKVGFAKGKRGISYLVASHLSPDDGNEALKVRRRRIVRTRVLDDMSKESLNETIKRLDSTIQRLDAHIGELSEATRAQLEFMHVSINTLETKLTSRASQSAVDDIRGDVEAANKKLDLLVARIK
jgi:hypothetical protein